jgi:hypothetical protein
MGLAGAAQESTAQVIKMRHVKDTRDGSLKLAAQEDPMETD